MRPLRLIAAATRQADHALGRLAGRARVLVDVRTPMNLAVLGPVWRVLVDDPRVTVAFTAEDVAGIRGALAANGLADRLMTAAKARWTRFDLALTADAWNHVALARCRRRMNFFHGVAGKYDLDDPARLAGAALGSMDRLAFINAERRDRYVAAGLVSPAQAVLVGFPKLDALVNGAWDAATVRRELGLAPALPTILYAPTFSTANSLHTHGDSIVDALLATGANVVVKLHDRSMIPSPKHTAGIDWPARLARFTGNTRFALATGSDAGPYLAAADVLVTDHSTVGFEFALLDRPIVVIDAPALKAEARIADDKWQMLRAIADVVYTPATLGDAVEAALASPGRVSPERARARELFAHAGSATNRALAVVYELLELSYGGATVQDPPCIRGPRLAVQTRHEVR